MFQGDNIYIRAAEFEDARIVSAWLNNFETNKNLDIIYPTSKRYADEFLIEYEGSSNKKLFMIDNKERKPIGIITIDNIKWEYRSCEIGIVIYDSNYRGKGLGRDALKVVIDFIFNSMNMHLIYLRALEENEVAINLYKSLGFEFEGILRHRYYKEGKYLNIISMSLIKEGEE